MPRVAENTQSLLDDLKGHLERLTAAAREEGRESALSELRSLVGGGGALRPGMRRGPGRRPSPPTARPVRPRRSRGGSAGTRGRT